ncbi:MAG: bifunctional DNA primase/polymerase, partial [Candidatus Eremiobacteraeota bacterium]|nr:bifunctional DNA primase/polymerase [Candidatus Eremiobacteraeota bacterium]
MPALTDLMDAAIAYARRGWHVFPCVPRGKVPLIEGGGGFRGATVDESIIRHWWATQPDANIGIATGASGLVVLDVDAKNDGNTTFDALRLEVGLEFFETATAGSPSGGQHVYYSAGGKRVPVGVNVLGPSLDIRAEGGYIVAPPSVGANGSAYKWFDFLSPDDCDLQTWPDELHRRMATRSEKAASIAEDGFVIQGGRNDWLTSRAGAMRNIGLSEAEIRAALREKNLASCKPPLDQSEVDGIAHSVARYE